MSDGMTHDASPPPAGDVAPPANQRPARPWLVRQVLEVLAVLVVFAAAGLAAGWLWERWWTPTTGVVVDGTWYSGSRVEGNTLAYDFPSLRHYFDATATFLLIGVVAGLVLAVLCALLGRRSELVMLGAVAVGSALACLVAYRFGVHLGPAAPATLAAAAKNGDVLPAALSLPGKSPFVGWTLGALIGLGFTYFLTGGVSESRRREKSDPRWLSRSETG